jgi:hypothetical protein
MHINVGVDVGGKVGVRTTGTEIVAAAVQLNALVPITEYVVVTVGLKPTPLRTGADHPDQTYVVAFPTPVKVNVFPEHKDGELAAALTVGNGLIDTDTAVEEVPQAFVPVTM